MTRDATLFQRTSQVRGLSHWIFNGNNRLLWMLVLLGILLRVGIFAQGRSFWMDENSLRASITGRAPFDLSEPPAGGQLVPTGFLVVQRIIVQALGDSVYTLRLVSLAAGILTVLGLRAVVLRAGLDRAGWIGLALAVFSYDLIYYASELKPYACDAAVAVLGLWIGLRAIEPPWTKGERIAALTVGLIAPWFSYASVFVLPVVVLVWGLAALRRRDRAEITWAAGAGLLWGVSGLGSFGIALAWLGGRDHMHHFWDFAFVPIPPTSLDEARALLQHALNLFGNPARIITPMGAKASAALGLALCVLGTGRLIQTRQWKFLTLLLMPMALHVVASAVRVYPFHGRLVLYLAPAVLLLVGHGVSVVLSRVPWRWGRRAVLAFLFVMPVWEVAGHLLVTHYRVFDPHGDLHPDPFS